MSQLKMYPNPGSQELKFSGDTASFTLTLDQKLEGQAFLRTNLSRGHVYRQAVIDAVEGKQGPFDEGWADLPMTKVSDTEYEIHFPLLQIGHFEAKAYFLLEDGVTSLWPEGHNYTVNVEPASYRSNNSVYCAFVRQFGANKQLAEAPKDENFPGLKELDQEGFSVIPPSGKFRDLIDELDHIFDELGCRILHLLPINPTPTTYARMGRYGSPYAALDFTAVNNELCEFELATTPVDQFIELSEAVHRKQGKLFLDIAINHTGWAAKIHETHPEWLRRHDNGDIYQPGAWGTVWEDLTELDHHQQELWVYLADVFLTWCERGVDGFRCDAGYMIPEPAWTYITAKVRQKFPDTIFLLEGLGGPWETTENMIDKCNLNWAYSELFQNYDKNQIRHYLEYSQRISQSKGLMIHYSETHDNMRLAAQSPEWSRQRNAICALLSHNGAFGFTNGVEWYAKEKVIVHRASGLNWGAKENQIAFLKRLNDILRYHPAFFSSSRLQEIENNNDQILSYLRFDRKNNHPLLVVINLDLENAATASFDKAQLQEYFGAEAKLQDYISDKTSFDVNSADKFELEAGEILCLAPEQEELSSFTESEMAYAEARSQILRLKNEASDKPVTDPVRGEEIRRYLAEPVAFMKSLGLDVNQWNFPHDLNRDYLYTPGSAIFFQAQHPFRVSLLGKTVNAIQNDNGYFVTVYPQKDRGTISYEEVKLQVYKDHKISNYSSRLVYLTAQDVDFTEAYPAHDTSVTALSTNGRGGMAHINLAWPNFDSRYDCLLGANLSTEFPENRHIMWRRCRVYGQVNAHHFEFNEETLIERKVRDGVANLTFKVHAGMGRFITIRMSIGMLDGENATQMVFERIGDQCDSVVRLIVRPDIEDRNFHMETKAGGGLEDLWASKVSAEGAKLTFAPDPTRTFILKANNGHFSVANEWMYNLHMKNEAARGLQSSTDLFSPGYFTIDIKPNETAQLIGQVLTPSENKELKFTDSVFKKCQLDDSFSDRLKKAISHYVVKRDEHKTVIAGYPWFLDWGRDTLICVRGLISAGYLAEVRDTLLQFGKFEEGGTLPNMIHGNDASNRDTTDAPLWYFTACEDYVAESGDTAFWKAKAGNKTITQVLKSIVENIQKGTKNGIKMDADSGLVFSPSHFTWMDTNYPAGTPRRGYPIEIQALWHKGLKLLHTLSKQKAYGELATQVQASVEEFFYIDEAKHISDCLHSQCFVPAAQAQADDAIRCNQLFAVTLDLVPREKAIDILESSEQLLIPGAIRSLADQKVNYPLPVYGNSGQLLNNAHYPYWGHYEGDEDTRRKPAYHNGTAWSWPFPSYSEGLFKIYGEEAREKALAILNSSRILFDTGCLEQIPEVLDGSTPHTSRGCDAQAWGVTELYRVYKILQK